MPLSSGISESTLHAYLNCRSLPDEWYLKYGITAKRASSLEERERGHDSIINPNSETALTLFMLGNIDNWKQFSASGINPRSPESAGNSWNSGFFDDVRNGVSPLRYNSQPETLWSGVRCVDDSAFPPPINETPILLFEFEICSKCFHLVNGKAFKELSFLNVRDMRKWSRFDAVLIFPSHKRFVFFEAKLTSDISRSTESYPVNQIVRALESAFLLTHHKDSQYHGWTYDYIVLMPKRDYEYEASYSACILHSLQKHLGHYKRLLSQSGSKLPLGEYLDEFVQTSPEVTRVVFWSNLADAMKQRCNDFLALYYTEQPSPTRRGVQELSIGNRLSSSTGSPSCSSI